MITAVAIYNVAGKSLTRPGKKQATATKLGIYSTYFPRSSIHFLARCSNFCRHSKKIKDFFRPPRSPQQEWSLRRTKNGERAIFFFSVQGTGGSPKLPDTENRVGEQVIGSPVRPFNSGLHVPGEPGHCRARPRPPSYNNIYWLQVGRHPVAVVI